MKRHRRPTICPGELLRDEVIQERGLDVEQGAALLGILPNELNKIYCGDMPITRQIAIRISEVFGGHPDLWIRLQKSFLQNLKT